jgi:hypothetical protein
MGIDCTPLRQVRLNSSPLRKQCRLSSPSSTCVYQQDMLGMYCPCNRPYTHIVTQLYSRSAK